MEEWRPDPQWKLPGGSIETDDEGEGDAKVNFAVRRELRQETSYVALRDQVNICRREVRKDGEKYRPFFCAVEATEEELDALPERVQDEQGNWVCVAKFSWNDVLKKRDILPQHRSFVCAVADVILCATT